MTVAETNTHPIVVPLEADLDNWKWNGLEIVTFPPAVEGTGSLGLYFSAEQELETMPGQMYRLQFALFGITFDHTQR